MPANPRPSDAPRIRRALKAYHVTSIITGSFLLLLCLMMLFRYGPMAFGEVGLDLELFGPYGFLALTPRELITGINLTMIILIVHGWFYVAYLYTDFRLWSLARWPIWRFLLVALGGVIPLSSFFIEHHVRKQVLAQLADLEQRQPAEAAR